MRFCPNGCRPTDDIVDTLKTSIKGRVTEPASFVSALWLHVLSSKRHKHAALSVLLVADNKDEKCFPLLPLNHLFLPQFFSFMEFERSQGNCLIALQHSQ